MSGGRFWSTRRITERAPGIRSKEGRSTGVQMDPTSPVPISKPHEQPSVASYLESFPSVVAHVPVTLLSCCGKKCIEARADEVSMVLGENVGLEMVESLSARASIGKFMGKAMSRSHHLIGWRKVLGYLPRFHILVKGWLCFKD